jgi:hypothetical protein
MTKIIKIETLFERSAERMLSDAQLQPDPALVAEGWERRFTADVQRTQEAVELYAQLGYEVRTESLQPEQLTGDCEGCRSQVLLEFKTIYTRKKTN